MHRLNHQELHKLLRQAGTEHEAFTSLKARAYHTSSIGQKLADMISHLFGSMWFLALNSMWFIVWLTINLGWLPGVEPFDPYPFGLLTTAVSLEAIILSIFVLISQNKASRISEIREELDLKIDVITEREITKILDLAAQLAAKQGIDVHNDKELMLMLKNVNPDTLQKQIEKEV